MKKGLIHKKNNHKQEKKQTKTPRRKKTTPPAKGELTSYVERDGIECHKNSTYVFRRCRESWKRYHLIHRGKTVKSVRVTERQGFPTEQIEIKKSKHQTWRKKHRLLKGGLLRRDGGRDRTFANETIKNISQREESTLRIGSYAYDETPL